MAASAGRKVIVGLAEAADVDGAVSVSTFMRPIASRSDADGAGVPVITRPTAWRNRSSLSTRDAASGCPAM